MLPHIWMQGNKPKGYRKPEGVELEFRPAAAIRRRLARRRQVAGVRAPQGFEAGFRPGAGGAAAARAAWNAPAIRRARRRGQGTEAGFAEIARRAAQARRTARLGGRGVQRVLGGEGAIQYPAGGGPGGALARRRARRRRGAAA